MCVAILATHTGTVQQFGRRLAFSKAVDTLLLGCALRWMFRRVAEQHSLGWPFPIGAAPLRAPNRLAPASVKSH